MSSTNPQRTDFALDILGRYVCNDFEEAKNADAGANPNGPFNVIVIGGGSFGAAFAQHLLSGDKSNSYRILVLEAGPLALPEHVQNLPMLGVGAPGPTSIAELRAAGQDGKPRSEVWGLPWHSDTKFPGLA